MLNGSRKKVTTVPSSNPANQFEWTWLLACWAKFTGRSVYQETAEKLFRYGAKGISQKHDAAVNTLDDELN